MIPIDFQTKVINRFKNSPTNEHSLVREFFGNKKTGFYVDIGANIGFYSKIYTKCRIKTWMDKNGWRWCVRAFAKSKTVQFIFLLMY